MLLQGRAGRRSLNLKHASKPPSFSESSQVSKVEHESGFRFEAIKANQCPLTGLGALYTRRFLLNSPTFRGGGGNSVESLVESRQSVDGAQLPKSAPNLVKSLHDLLDKRAIAT